ncbi:MAG: FAD-binding oxidoreductase [Pseudomonadota bacterium]
MTTYTAQRLPKHRGPAGWAAILGDVPPGPILDEDTAADVVIVGAGFAGLSAARRLKQIDASLDIVVLEAGAIAEGAAGRNSGFMIDLPHDLASDDYAGSGNDRAMITMNRHAQSFAKAAVEEYAIDQAFFDAAGKVNGAVSDAALAHNHSYARHLESLGERSETLDAAQMADVTGSRYYRAGLYTPGTVMLQPAGYIRGLAAGLRRGGVRIFENSPARRIERGRVHATNASVRCAKVIIAANGHLESFGIAPGRLMQIFLFATITPELDPSQIGGQPRWGITPSDPMGTTMRRINGPQGGNRIVTRTCATLRSGMQSRRSDLKRAAAIMQSKFEARFPQFTGLKMAHSWAGHLCLSRNGVSVTRAIDNGIWSACVQNGLGTARGTLTGIAAAEMAMGKPSKVAAHFNEEAHPTKLPPRLIRDPGANAILRWKEWRARAE